VTRIPDPDIEPASSLARASTTPTSIPGEISTVAAMQIAADHFHASLNTSPIALQHIGWRGKVARELIEYFQLGLSDNTLSARTGESRALRLELGRIGLIRTNGDERFAGSFVVPVTNATGEVVQLRGGEYHVVTGRSTNERFFPHEVDAVFNVRGLAVSEELIIAPTAMDVLRFWYAGHVNITALGEGLALTDGHLAAMKRAGTRRVVLALGVGGKSDAIAIAAAGRLVGAGISTYRATIGRRFMPTSRQWGQSIREAKPMLGAPARPEPPQLDLDWSRVPKKESR